MQDFVHQPYYDRSQDPILIIQAPPSQVRRPVDDRVLGTDARVEKAAALSSAGATKNLNLGFRTLGMWFRVKSLGLFGFGCV